jgi:hypothetical protein
VTSHWPLTTLRYTFIAAVQTAGGAVSYPSSSRS